MKTGRGGDAVFGVLTKGASIVVISIVAFVAAFLLWRAVPALMKNEASFLFSRIWEPATVPPKFGIAGLFYTTVVLSAWALLLAVPVSIGLAPVITQVAPRRSAPSWRGWSTCWPRCRRSSTACGELPDLAPLLLPVGTAVAGFMDNSS